MSEELDVKKLYDEMQTTFTALKTMEANRDEQIKKHGEAGALLKESIEAVRNDLADVSTKYDEALKRIDEIETKASRPGATGNADETKAAFFDGYCRKGATDSLKALSVGDDTQAGYLAPPEFVMEIIKGVVTYSPIRDYARVRSTSMESVQIPKKTGHLSAVWIGETGTKAETTGMAYGLVDIPTHEMYALVDVTNKMLEDSAFNIEGELRQEFTEQFGVAEGTAFVSGSAVGRPEGILTNSSVSTVASGNADYITADGIIDAYHTLADVYAQSARWYLRRATVGVVRKLKDGMGNYLWQPGIAAGNPNLIYGLPYTECPDMPAEATNAYPIVLGDLARGYTIIDRIAITVLRDPFTQATGGKIRFIARRRVGGQVTLAEAIVKLRCVAA